MVLKRYFAVFILCLLQINAFSQVLPTALQTRNLVLANAATLTLTAPDETQLAAEDSIREEKGLPYRFGIAAFTAISSEDYANWTILPSGDRIWRLHIVYKGAQSLSFLFSDFRIYDRTTFNVYGPDGKQLHATLTADDVQEHFQQHIPICAGDEVLLELYEPANARRSAFFIDRVMYNYRSTETRGNDKDFNDSGACQINVNCSPTGNGWQDEKRGIARLLCIDGSIGYWCSGSLVNNLAQDCKPYMLTTQHCGLGVTQTDLNQWVFYFGYEAPGCSDPATQNGINVADKRFIGGSVVSNSEGVTAAGEITSSDFMLIRIGSVSTETAVVAKLKSSAINAYWNGWSAINTPAVGGGASIHHPKGDIKKISTYTATLISTNYSAGGSNTHWRVTWSPNQNGFGIVEPGSSGAPIFNSNNGNSRIVGTLSGGYSSCDALTLPDLYGKMSYHWASNGTAANRQLKPWLDPAGTGQLVCDGSSDPCAGPAPGADFTATPLTLAPGGSVAFTDLSENAPTSWSWTITPATGWSYANGTNANSQHPQVLFSDLGSYTVSLVAANSFGSDTKTKEAYILVTIISEPCNATALNCDEFISRVQLGTIDNATGCDKYAYYETPTTLLYQGTQYQLIIVPSTDGGEGAYLNDEIAAWVDWNRDFDFYDTGERIAYALVTQTWNNVFYFTVPADATGPFRMRVRISYAPTEGPIDPCGETALGEVEDYLVSVTSPPLSLEEEQLIDALVYPNPAHQSVTVVLGQEDEDWCVEITDLSGNCVLKTCGIQGTSKELDISGIARGSYLIHVTSGKGSAVKQLIKF